MMLPAAMLQSWLEGWLEGGGLAPGVVAPSISRPTAWNARATWPGDVTLDLVLVRWGDPAEARLTVRGRTRVVDLDALAPFDPAEAEALVEAAP